MTDKALAEKKRQKRLREKLLKERRRKVLFVMVEVVILLTVSIGCYAATIFTSYDREDLDSSVFKASVSYQKVETKVVEETNAAGEVIGTRTEEYYSELPSNGYRNILLLGLDSRSQYSMDISGVQSDVMIIASINNETGDIKMVSVLRDTVMKMEEGSVTAYNKANSQYSSGGISKTVAMINRNLDLDIEDYVVVNWYGVAECINQLGGIEMTLPDNAKIINAFNGYLTAVNNHTGLWAPQIWEPGTYNMTGTQVVAYCRIRYGGLEDTGRAGNQREAITKILEKAKLMAKTGQFDALLNVAKTGLANIKTNMTMIDDILPIITKVSSYSIADTSQFPLEFIDGEGTGRLGTFYEHYGIESVVAATDFENEVKQLHKFLFNDNSYEPSDFIKKVSKEIKERSKAKVTEPEAIYD